MNRSLLLFLVGFLPFSVCGQEAVIGTNTIDMMGPPLDPSDPSYYDSLRDENSELLKNVTIAANSNVFRVALNGEGGNEYRLAEIKTFLPLSNGTHIRQGYQDDAAAALLALYHFNNIDLSPILRAEDIAGCDLKLTMEIVDSKFSPIGSTRVFTESLHTKNTLSTPLPTAVIGAYRSATTSPLAILTGVNGIPQASYASGSTDFDVKEQFPLFGRTVTSSTGDAKVALDYFISIGASHVGVLFVTVSYHLLCTSTVLFVMLFPILF